MKKIFLLPGLDGSGISLHPLRQDLIARGFSVHIINYPPKAEWTYDDYAAFASTQIENSTQPGEKFAVFAESFGGPLVPRIYRVFKSRIVAIVFCATFVKNPVYAARAMRVINRILKPSAFPSFAYSMSFLGLNPRPETVEVFKTIKKSVPEDVVRSRINQVLSIENDAQVLKDFERIPVPIVYIQARFDTVVLPNGYAGIKSLNPHAVLEVIDSAHLVSHAESAKVASIMHNFITPIAF